MDFKYGKHIDLLYHGLAHLHVHNASDLYSPAYIDFMKRLRNSDWIIPASMEGYYNENFERLSIINFLPFYSTGWDELRQMLLGHQGFTDRDKEMFIQPFIQLLDGESAMYFAFGKIHTGEYPVKEFLLKIFCGRNFIRMSACLARFTKTQRRIYLSALRAMAVVSAAGMENPAPFPQNTEGIDDTFFTLLHEYSHQITDPLLNTYIRMDNDSHDISENAVILFDYYLIQAIREADTRAYFHWLSPIVEGAGEKLSTDGFFYIFRVPDTVHYNIKEACAKIIKNKGNTQNGR